MQIHLHNSKNILFVIPEMSMGGAQRSLAKVSSALRLHYNIWVVVFNKNHAIAKTYQSDLISLDVDSGPGLVTKTKAFISRIARLRVLKKKLNIDISISFLEGADYVNILSRVGDKVILSIRGSKVYDENMHRAGFSWRRQLIRYLYKRADAIVCVNRGIADEMRDYYSIKNVPIQVINNFYDINEILHLADQQLPRSIENLYLNQTLIMSGRIAAEKGHAFIIKLFAELRKQRNELRLILIGDGPERELIMRLAESLNLIVVYSDSALSYASNPDIYITGDQENVFSYLKLGTLYILNSSSEGFPNGLAEAMICGLPVIAADCPYGPREILTKSPQKKSLIEMELSDYGILLPVPGSAPSKTISDIWLKAILRLLDSTQLRSDYSTKGLKRMMDFTSEQMVQKWLEIVKR